MKFTTIVGEEIEIDCPGCSNRDFSKLQALRILDTKLWAVGQDYELAYPGLIVIAPMRRVSNYADLTDEEILEFNQLMKISKQAISDLFHCNNICYTFYEKQNGHFHMVIIPLHGLVKLENKYSALSELMQKAPEIKADKKLMAEVLLYVDKLRIYFKERF